MPRNGTGTFSLYTPGNPVIPDTDIEASWANNTLNDIATAVTNSLSKDGQTKATGNLDLNSNKIINLANATNPQDAVAFGQLDKYSTIGKNLIINPEFYVNNGNSGTAYVSGAVLASGQYGHEMWKAGASGGDYTFTSSTVTPNTITIASGKTLIQNIETSNVLTNSYILSWTGTAQARVGINSTTPSGTYAASPIVITGQTAGQPLSIEFNNGTLSMPTLNEGSVVQTNPRRSYADVLEETETYALKILASESATEIYAEGVTSTSDTLFLSATYSFKSRMRATPSIANSATFSALRASNGPSTLTASPTALNFTFGVSNSSTGFRANAGISSGFIFLNARI